MAADHFTALLALIGIVIVVSSLVSGVVERSGVPHVAIFLALGAAVGPAGLALIDITLESPTLRVIATVGLMLVLFSDAVAFDVVEVRRQRRLAFAVLGPGTLVSAALVSLAAWLLLDLGAPASAILGASIASTDPVLLRTLLRRQQLPATARLALRLESGMNDVVLLPIVVLAMAAMQPGGLSSAAVGRSSVALFVLGPALGALVGFVGIRLLDFARQRWGVRRDYESLYALGLALAAYTAAEMVGGSGFLAAFAAGLTIAALDVELCDCFLDYGEATAEMFLLLTFVAFGASLIWSGAGVVNGRTLLFAFVGLFGRTLVLLPVLARVGVDPQSRRLIAWFGPRGLSSLLLVLLPVFAGVPGSAYLFSVTCLVVLLSVVLHGAIIAAYLRRASRAAPEAVPPAGTVATSAPGRRIPPEPSAGRGAATAPGASREERVPETITLDELRELEAAGEPIVLVDSRTERNIREDALRARGAVRVAPDDAVRSATALRLSQHATLVVYCA